MKSRLIFVFLLLGGVLFAETQVLLNTGHRGEVTQITYHNPSSMIFSASTDGSIKAWDIRTKDLARIIHESSHPIKSFRLNPEKTHITFLESNSLDFFRLTTLDWRTGEILFTQLFKTEPISYNYSALGNYLIINKVDIPSLSIIDTRTGKNTGYLQNINSVVSYSYLGSSEKTIMTYSSSGILQFWDMKTGLVKARAETLSDLKYWNVTSNKLYLTGIKGEEVYVIDRLTGKVISQMTVEGLSKAALNYEEDDLVLIRNLTDRVELQQYRFTEDRFNQGIFKTDVSSAQLSAIGYGMGMVITGSYQGELEYFYLRSPQKFPLGKNIVQGISDMTLKDNQLRISTKEGFYQFTSDFFLSGDQEELNNTEVSFLPEGAQQIVINSQDEDLYLLPRDRETSILRVTPEFTTEALETSMGLVKKGYSQGENNLILTEAGEIHLFNTDFSQSLFQYSFLGLLDAVFYGENRIIGSHVSQRRSPLLSLNYETGETIPLEDSSQLIYALASNGEEVYAIGVEEEDFALKTNLLFFKGNLLEEKKVLKTLEGEHLDHYIYYQDSLFTTFPDHRLHQYQEGQWSTFEDSQTYPIGIRTSQNLVLALNKDQSISFWDRKSQSFLGTLSLLNSGEWVFLSGHAYYGSPGIERHLSFLYF